MTGNPINRLELEWTDEGLVTKFVDLTEEELAAQAALPEPAESRRPPEDREEVLRRALGIVGMERHVWGQ